MAPRSSRWLSPEVEARQVAHGGGARRTQAHADAPLVPPGDLAFAERRPDAAPYVRGGVVAGTMGVGATGTYQFVGKLLGGGFGLGASATAPDGSAALGPREVINIDVQVAFEGYPTGSSRYAVGQAVFVRIDRNSPELYGEAFGSERYAFVS